MADDEDSSTLTTWDIQSECIATLAYDRAQGLAIFTFVRGSGKEYTAPISLQQATAWAHAASVGEYFNNNIKGVHVFRPITAI